MSVEPLLVVVGPTSSGKTDLAVMIAERFGGEVVSADAFAVYRGLDIGTAKPDAVLRARVPHHLIDVADPRQRYSAGAFLRDADAAIAEIRGRGAIPVVAGGTHFYVRALLYGLFPEPGKSPALRRELEQEWRRDRGRMRRRLEELDPAAAARIDPADRQRTLRALEVSIVAGRPMSELWLEHAQGAPRYRPLMLGLDPSRDVLHARIAGRVENMFAQGLLAEVERLVEEGVPESAHALKAIGYRECLRVLRGEWSRAEAMERTRIATRQLAKRQRTWLRREPDLVRLAGQSPEEAVGRAVELVEGCRGERQ